MDTRIFVHKKEQFQVESESLAAELRQSLSLKEDFGLTKYNMIFLMPMKMILNY